MDSSRLETVLVDDVWSSLSNGLKTKGEKNIRNSKRCPKNIFKMIKTYQVCAAVSVPPGDLQVQLHRPEVVDIHGKRLGERAEQVEHFAGHGAHHHVIGQAL